MVSMLVNLHHLNPSVLRQCTIKVAKVTRSTQNYRQLVTSLVLRQSSDFSNRPPTDWIEESNKARAQHIDPNWHVVTNVFTPPRLKGKSGESPEYIWTRKEAAIKELRRPNNAYSGRSVSVHDGDVVPALIKLKTILNTNAVRHTNVRDERHEKKGEKRNRLRSLRWRRRFAHEVRKKVQLVNEIRARGA